MNWIEPKNSMNENLKRLQELLEPHLNKFDLREPRSKRKFDELNQTAIFLMFYDHSWTISESRDRPDFIIQKAERFIGLEHTSIRDENLISQEGTLTDIFLRAESKLLDEKYMPSFLANNLINRGSKIKKSESTNLIEHICEVVKTFYETQILIDSEVIENIVITPHHTISLSVNYAAWWQAPLTVDLIKSTIRKKEQLIPRYKANTDVEQWLLLVTGHGNKGSYALPANFNYKHESEFEKVFLYEINSLSIFEL